MKQATADLVTHGGRTLLDSQETVKSVSRVFFMILISPDSVRTKAQALFVHEGGPTSVYVLPKVTRGHFQGFSAIWLKEDGQLGLNVVMLTAGF